MARSAALALNANNSTIMNKLGANNIKPYKGRYLIITTSGSSYPAKIGIN